MTADQTYELIHDELLLDGRARLNLATFVTTWMEPQAGKLMAECFPKDMIDNDEYRRPQRSRTVASTWVRGSSTLLKPALAFRPSGHPKR